MESEKFSKIQGLILRKGIRGVAIFAGSLLIASWSLIPIFWLIVASVAVDGYLPLTIGLPQKMTLINYWKVLVSDSIWPYMFNSFIVAIAVTLIVLLLSLPAAYGISRCEFRFARITWVGILVLRMIPGMILLLAFYLVVSKLRLIDTRVGLILVYIPINLPFGIWLLKGFCDEIPKEIEEAAWVDGASPMQTFMKIIAPLSAPNLAVVAVFIFLFCSIEYMFAVTLTSKFAITVPVKIAGYADAHVIHWQTIAAATLVSALPIILIYLLVQRYIVKAISAGAVKG